MTPQRQRLGGAVRAQKRQPRKDGWTRAQEALFLEALAETCNASEAARTVGKSRTSAYRRRASDPGFAQAWAQALEIGYSEIELLLMRAALHGSEVEEVMLDGDGAVKGRKVKRVQNLTVALRLLIHYRDKVAQIRAGQTQERPDSADAIARVDAVVGAVRRRRGMR
ncbi:hypothetical protein Q4610_07640 [Sphingobium sp. HBC34]|uniref:Terminase n=1 Tax=Sphingobium cyanobacteriorum TaxID=3063954 RepID=A0ABT8ZKN8_9SPHN|nr:hypothetical protein [Sphingobium sp. HBC34]